MRGQSLIVLFLSFLLAGCCSSDGKKLDGKTYTVHVKSDFDAVVDVNYFEKAVHDKNPFISYFLLCGALDEVRETKTTSLNAFQWHDISAFSDSTPILISVKYNGKTVGYATDVGFNVFIKQSNFQ